MPYEGFSWWDEMSRESFKDRETLTGYSKQGIPINPLEVWVRLDSVDSRTFARIAAEHLTAV